MGACSDQRRGSRCGVRPSAVSPTSRVDDRVDGAWRWPRFVRLDRGCGRWPGRRCDVVMPPPIKSVVTARPPVTSRRSAALQSLWLNPPVESEWTLLTRKTAERYFFWFVLGRCPTSSSSSSSSENLCCAYYTSSSAIAERPRDATHELLWFAKLRSGIFEPPFWGLRGNVDASCTSLEEAWSTSYRW